MVVKSDRYLLRKLARDAIKYGLMHQSVMSVELETMPKSVHQPGASFVTLFLKGSLRGCIGSIEAHRPLAQDVASNAYAAAFRDHRFEPVTDQIVDDLTLYIAVLTTPEQLECHSEQALIDLLQPGRDGLIIEDDTHRATFLPAVWDTLPNPERFVAELKRKAGFTGDYWSDSLRCYRYRTERF